jgi:hypothetical protein
MPDLEGLRVEERDARMAVYRDRERRRATLALDRYVELVYGGSDKKVSDVAADRLVEAVGDYVLSRLHNNGHYGVAEEGPDVMARARLARGGRGEADDTPIGKFAAAAGHRSPDYVSDDEQVRAWNRGDPVAIERACMPRNCPTCGDDGKVGFGKADYPVCIDLWHAPRGGRPQPVDNDRFPTASDVQSERWPRGQ